MYIADLHIHSRFSRATSRDGNPENLELWARRKGIDIVGTGDFTHPEWRKELEEKLEPAEEGFYTLKDEYRIHDPSVPDNRKPRFVVTGEISSIYKKGERVRKVHSVILLPGLEAANLLSKKLEAIGNIHSDGRPILGLPCRDLLEIAMNLCPDSMYVPAHIWTPHFALFGAFSGFDSVEECFEDMTPYVRAMETGLSSDPPMNWRLSALDSYQLISNSDAHSPAKLGREANLLDIDLSYQGLYGAIQRGEGLFGTIEFFPEEGKYHYDGHRKCHLCLSPAEAEQYGGKCPVCGRKLTIGVFHRVEQLADRPEGYILSGARPFESLVPLPEVIAASTGRSAASRKVEEEYEAMVGTLGAEFEILREIPIEEIRRTSGHLISEGIRRLREGRVERIPGYDGEYGTIRLFEPSEIENPDGQMSLFTSGELAAMRETAAAEAASERIRSAEAEKKAEPEPNQEEAGRTESLNERQREAVTAAGRVIAVVAGPGTGKTKTLVTRLLYLLRERKVKPSEITAVTFTKKAAGEMRDRLERELGGRRTAGKIRIGTFHAICYELLKKSGREFSLADDMETMELAKMVLEETGLKKKPKEFLQMVSLKKTGLLREESAELSDACGRYQEFLSEGGLLDFDDLLLEALSLAGTKEEREAAQGSFSFLLVDEFQDISPLQFELIKAWNRDGKELFVIGDPDQAIYSFRGADSGCFERLSEICPELKRITLEENYRSSKPILDGALSVIEKNGGEKRRLHAQSEGGKKIRLAAGKSELSEDIFIAKEINRMTGGMDMLDAQEEMEKREERKLYGFSDIAVLYRTHRQAALLEDCLKKEAIPYVVVGKEDFLLEKEVRGTVCFFQYVLDKEDAAAGMTAGRLLWELPENCLAGTIVESMAEQYEKKAKKEKPAKLLDAWGKELGFSGLACYEKLRSMALFYKTMAEFLEALSFGGEGDLRRCGGKSYTADAVTLMTLHGSKGLEFPAVFLCGVRKDMIPLESGKEPVNEPEERRLFYVGMTRAKEELILTSSGEESVFLKDIPPEILLREKAGNKRENDGGRQLSLFDFMDEK